MHYVHFKKYPLSVALEPKQRKSEIHANKVKELLKFKQIHIGRPVRR